MLVNPMGIPGLIPAMNVKTAKKKDEKAANEKSGDAKDKKAAKEKKKKIKKVSLTSRLALRF